MNPSVPAGDPAQYALIVDDHPAIRVAVATRMASTLGFTHVHEAGSAVGAT